MLAQAHIQIGLIRPGEIADIDERYIPQFATPVDPPSTAPSPAPSADPSAALFNTQS